MTRPAPRPASQWIGLGTVYALVLVDPSPAAVAAAIGRGTDGFTMIEVIVALVVGMIVLGSVVQLLIVQGVGYRKQREEVDIRETAREAASLLSWDGRLLSASFIS